jgi:predicted O-methyltransferase YrrM
VNHPAQLTFADASAAAADVEGWMTPDQARLLWDCAGAVPAKGRIVEIGSFRGRSMIMLASAAPDGVELVAIDPHIGTDRGPQEIVTTEALGQSDIEAFQANLAAAGVADRVRHVRELSSAAQDAVDDPLDLLYIDGAHRFGPARADIVDWGRRVRSGGTLLVHDSFSSIGVTLALLTSITWSGQWRYVGRKQSMAHYRRDRLRGVERLTNPLRQLAQLGWFARNVVVKGLMVAHLGRFTRLLGHDGETWPY